MTVASASNHILSLSVQADSSVGSVLTGTFQTKINTWKKKLAS